MRSIKISNRSEEEIILILENMKENWILGQIKSALRACLPLLGREIQLIDAVSRLSTRLRQDYTSRHFKIKDYFSARVEVWDGRRIIRIAIPLQEKDDIVEYVNITIGDSVGVVFWVSISYATERDFELATILGRTLFGHRSFEQPLEVWVDETWRLPIRAALICLLMNLDGKGLHGPILDQAIEEGEYKDLNYWGQKEKGRSPIDFTGINYD